MTKKKNKKPIINNEIKLPKPELKNESEWITGTFKTIVEIVKITSKSLMEIEMVDSNGNIIIWCGRNYDTDKIKLNNKLMVVGRAKEHIICNGIKKTLIKYLTY